EPAARPVRLGVLGDAALQRRHPAGALDAARPAQRRRDIPGLARRARRHVVRAVRHRRRVAAPRLPALVVGHLLADGVGLRDALRLVRALPDVLHALRALRAHDLDRRDAAPARGEGARGGGLVTVAPARLWGVVAEFESPTTLLVAAHRVREAGYRRIDAHV